jgi:hypothetical protein
MPAGLSQGPLKPKAGLNGAPVGRYGCGELEEPIRRMAESESMQ